MRTLLVIVLAISLCNAVLLARLVVKHDELPILVEHKVMV